MAMRKHIEEVECSQRLESDRSVVGVERDSGEAWRMRRGLGSVVVPEIVRR